MEKDVSSEKLSRKELEGAFIAQAAKLITDTTWETNWNIVAEMFMFSSEAEDTHRLFRSQVWNDPDYPDRVYNFFKKAYNEESKRAIAMISYIIDDLIRKDQLDDDDLSRYPIIKPFLKEGKAEPTFSLPRLREKRYINFKELPDDFYYTLVETINRSFAIGIYPAVSVFSRKLLENLLVDILRKKFTGTNVEMYFDVNHRRHHSFNVLLKNFEENLDQFHPSMPSLDHEFINKLNKFREVGNSAAHTLELDVRREDLKGQKDDLEFLTKCLVRLFNNI